MKRKTFTALFSFILVALLAAGCSGGNGATGTLAGKVTIGPISPVERVGETTPVPPEVYAARKVMVYTKQGGRLVQQIDLADDGTYSAEFKPGKYYVDINHAGIDHSSQVPVTVEIVSGETYRLDIDIDTGIR